MKKAAEGSNSSFCLHPSSFDFRVTDGTRTRDVQDHNLALYQLSYGHRTNVQRERRGIVARPAGAVNPGCRARACRYAAASPLNARSIAPGVASRKLPGTSASTLP